MSFTKRCAFGRRWCIISYALLLVFAITSGCANPEDSSGKAFRGSHDLIATTENPSPSSYTPADPYEQLVDFLLVRHDPIEGGGSAGIQRWDWLVGPQNRSAEFSFDFPVYVTIIAGEGQLILSGSEETRTVKLTGNTSLIVQPNELVVIANSSDQPIVIRATYLVGPAYKRT